MARLKRSLLTTRTIQLKRSLLVMSGIGSCMGFSFGINYSLENLEGKSLDKKIAHILGFGSLGIVVGSALPLILPIMVVFHSIKD